MFSYKNLEKNKNIKTTTTKKTNVMKTLYTLLLAFLFTGNLSAQVGINTERPKSTLQIQKKAALDFADGLILPRISGDSLKMKDAAYGIDQHGAMVFVTSPVTASSLKTTNVIEPGLYSYDGTFTHANSTKGMWMEMEQGNGNSGSGAYAMRAAGSLGLLDLSLNLFGSAFYSIPITNTSGAVYNIEITSAQVANNQYTVPQDGLYAINYSYRTGTGLRAELLSGNRPGAVIRKTSNVTSTVLDYRLFGGVDLILANVSLSQAQISHIYELKAGDILEFGIVRGGLSLGVLADSSAELSIYKIR